MIAWVLFLVMVAAFIVVVVQRDRARAEVEFWQWVAETPLTDATLLQECRRRGIAP